MARVFPNWQELYGQQPTTQLPWFYPDPIQFLVDDVLASRLDGNFDVIFDRGCFHVLEPEDRARYVETVSALLEPQGHLFLKCFQGPTRAALPTSKLCSRIV
jgi:cyclopropane fatty-acyl-phospholipid synthase-like methyltransferase